MQNDIVLFLILQLLNAAKALPIAFCLGMLRGCMHFTNPGMFDNTERDYFAKLRDGLVGSGLWWGLFCAIVPVNLTTDIITIVVLNVALWILLTSSVSVPIHLPPERRRDYDGWDQLPDCFFGLPHNRMLRHECRLASTFLTIWWFFAVSLCLFKMP